MAKQQRSDAGSVLDIVQPDHPWYEAMTRPHREVVARFEKSMRDATAGRQKASRQRDMDHDLRTKRKVVKATPEREARPDMRPGLIARYANRNEISKTQATAAFTLRRDYWLGDGESVVIGRLVASYGDAPPRTGGGFSPPYTGAESRAAFDAAMASVDGEQWSVLMHVVIEDRSAGSWAEAEGAKPREAASTGIRTLRKALDVIAQHYRLGAT